MIGSDSGLARQNKIRSLSGPFLVAELSLDITPPQGRTRRRRSCVLDYVIRCSVREAPLATSNSVLMGSWMKTLPPSSSTCNRNAHFAIGKSLPSRNSQGPRTGNQQSAAVDEGCRRGHAVVAWIDPCDWIGLTWPKWNEQGEHQMW